MLRTLSAMENLNLETLPTEEESLSSSSPTSYSSDDDVMIPIMGAYVQYQQRVQQQMMFLTSGEARKIEEGCRN